MKQFLQFTPVFTFVRGSRQILGHLDQRTITFPVVLITVGNRLRHLAVSVLCFAGNRSGNLGVVIDNIHKVVVFHLPLHNRIGDRLREIQQCDRNLNAAALSQLCGQLQGIPIVRNLPALILRNADILRIGERHRILVGIACGTAALAAHILDRKCHFISVADSKGKAVQTERRQSDCRAGRCAPRGCF